MCGVLVSLHINVFTFRHSSGSPEYILGDTACIEDTPRSKSTLNNESDERVNFDQEQLENAFTNRYPPLGFNNNPQAVVSPPCVRNQVEPQLLNSHPLSDPHSSRTGEYYLGLQPAQLFQNSLQQFESKTSLISMLENEDKLSLIQSDETGCSDEELGNPLHTQIGSVETLDRVTDVSPPISGQ